MSHVFTVKLNLSFDGRQLTLRVGVLDLASINLVSDDWGRDSCEISLLVCPTWRTQDSFEALACVLQGLGLDVQEFLGNVDEFSNQMCDKVVWNLPFSTIESVLNIGHTMGWPIIQSWPSITCMQAGQAQQYGIYFTEGDVYNGTWVDVSQVRKGEHTLDCNGNWCHDHMACQLQIELLEELRQTCCSCGNPIYLAKLDEDGLPAHLGAGFECFCLDTQSCNLCSLRPM